MLDAHEALVTALEAEDHTTALRLMAAHRRHGLADFHALLTGSAESGAPEEG